MPHNSIFIADCALGRGLFAAQAFAANETILRFTGPLIGLDAFIAMGEAEEANPLQVCPTDYIDLEPPGVFGNHSCEPNAGIRDDVVLVALRPIAAGEEVRCDYSTTMWEDDEPWTMLCRCGTASCRGVVDQFPTLPYELQARYLALKIVMPHRRADDDAVKFPQMPIHYNNRILLSVPAEHVTDIDLVRPRRCWQNVRQRFPRKRITA